MKSQQALEEPSTQTTLTKEDAVDLSERSLSRLIAESDLYDYKPTARALLREIAMMAMDGSEYDVYPQDMPDDYIADRKDWCWMSQWRLGLRVGISESQAHRLIKMFEDQSVLSIRYWEADNHVLHAQYKIDRNVLVAHQRPSQTKNVERPKRANRDYKGYENKGAFKKGRDNRRANVLGEVEFDDRP
jgi:hypothetical protein